MKETVDDPFECFHSSLGNPHQPPEHRKDAPLAPGIALAVGYVPNSGGDGWSLAAKEEGNRCCCVSSNRFDGPRIEPGSAGGAEGGFPKSGAPPETGRLPRCDKH